MRDIENFSSGIREEIVLAGPGYVPVRSRDVGCSEIEGGMRDHIRQKRQENATRVNRIFVD